MHNRVEEYVANPRRHFGRPYDVVDATHLALIEKRRILESWKLDAQQLADGTAENMIGGEETDLRDVSKALLQLDSFDQSLKPVASGASPNAMAPGSRAPLRIALPVGAVVGAGAGAVLAAASAGPVVAVALQGALIGLVAGGFCSVFLRSSSR